MSIIDKLEPRSVEEFKADFFLVMSAVKNIDREYAEAKQEFINDFVYLKRLFSDWNKKYRHLALSHKEDGMELKLLISVTGFDVKEVIKAASQIGEISKVNNVEVTIGGDELFEILSGSSRADIVFLTSEGDENSLTIEDSSGKVRLICNSSDLTNDRSPEFEICAYFSLISYAKGTNLQKYSQFFSFNTGFEESEGKGVSYQDTMRFFDKR